MRPSLGKTVLLIDDDEALRQSFRRRFERDGYRVLEAGDGTEAVTRVEREGVDLVVTDILMPGREGIETITALRARFPALPIIALTGGSTAYLKAAAKFGANRTFEKPVDLDELVGAVREALLTG
jgi:CheY-like chemotaxis protein